jgi:hypothetical protein
MDLKCGDNFSGARDAVSLRATRYWWVISQLTCLAIRKLIWFLVLGYRRLLRGSGEWSTHLISVTSLSDYRYHTFRASPLHIGGK